MRLKNNTLDIPLNIFWIISLTVLAFFLVTIGWVRFYATFDQDELEAVHTAWKVINDGVIYRDFFQHHHPLLYYLIVPFIKFFGETFSALFAVRMLVFFNYCLCGLVTFFIANLFMNRVASLLSVYLLLSATIFTKTLEIRPDGLQVLFSLIAVFFIVRYLRDYQEKLLDFMMSALSLSLAFLFLQKAIFLVIFINMFLLLEWRGQRLTFNKILSYNIIFITPFILYLLYLFAIGSLDYYLKFNWLLNILHPARFYFFHTLPLLFTSQVLCIFFSIGCLFYWHDRFLRILSLLAFWLLCVAAFIVKFSFAQYYAPAIPFMAIIAAKTLDELLVKRIYILIIMVSLCSGLIIGNSVFIARVLIKNIVNEQHEKIKYIYQNTNHSDYVYCAKAPYNVFRKDLNFFWFEARMNPEQSDLIPLYQKLSGKEYNLYSDIDYYKPKIISRDFLDINHNSIARYYKKNSAYDDLLIRMNESL